MTVLSQNKHAIVITKDTINILLKEINKSLLISFL